MSTVNKEICIFVENNPMDLYLNGIEILLKLLENVIREPENIKYRKIRLDNKIIKEKLISLNGMRNLLLSIGFQASRDDEYILPPHALLAKIKNYHDFISRRREIVKRGIEPSSSKELNKDEIIGSYNVKPTAKVKSNKIMPSKSYLQRISFPAVLSTKNQFLQSIEFSSDHVMQYEDEKLLKYGKSLIPVQRLTDCALKKLRQIQKAIKTETNPTLEEPCIKDLMLVELVNWFNTEFFEWINAMPCKVCQSNEHSERRTTIENGIRVEIGLCCGVETKFYRYNDILDLLHSRRGRCGEYANCFTFICRCLDYDARYVMATFDHVWTEVYSIKQKRWIHIDASDNVLDAPLMYQAGWKRKIDYIIAYSRDTLQDVTWRYSSNHKQTLSLRNKASEKELVKAIHSVRNKRQINISEPRIKFVTIRDLKELVDLMKPKAPTENERKGRSSGSLAWRLERGEQLNDHFYVFEPNDFEIKVKQFNLRYSCANDEYQRYVKEPQNPENQLKILETYKGWESAMYSGKNIFRKLEKDWKMTYLCRQENTDFGEITWRFNFSNLRIKMFSFKLGKQAFETGKIDLLFTSLDGEQIDDIKNLCGFTLKVNLSGGNGDTAWQHAQIFRQKLNSDEFPFDLQIEFY